MTEFGDQIADPTGPDLIRLARSVEPLVEFVDPSSEAELSAAEAVLGFGLPGQLRSFLLESDGATVAVRLSSGALVEKASPLVWPLSEIVLANQGFRVHPEQGPGGVLCFANAGFDGILFGHQLEGASPRSEVVAWYPYDGRIEAFAPSFARYLVGWLAGDLSI